MQIGCWLHVLFVLIFIIYLFIYSKRCQQKRMEATTCFYLLMQITCWLHVLFVLIFIIYLFIYSKQCQQKQMEPPPVFIYLCKSLVVRQGFRFNIQYLFIYLFIYLFKVMSAKPGGSNDLYYRLQRSWGKVMFLHPQLVAVAETRTVGKRAVCILLQCFLFYLSKLVVVIYF